MNRCSKGSSQKARRQETQRAVAVAEEEAAVATQTAAAATETQTVAVLAAAAQNRHHHLQMKVWPQTNHCSWFKPQPSEAANPKTSNHATIAKCQRADRTNAISARKKPVPAAARSRSPESTD